MSANDDGPANEVIATLAHAAQYTPAALLVWAAVLTIKHPEDSKTINMILVALLK